MSKPWYYTMGYPVKVLHDGVWKNAIICDGYRHEDGIISTMTEDGKKVWFGEPQKECCLKPNLPDDNPWIPVEEQLPKNSEYSKLYMTVQYPCGITTINGRCDHGHFIHNNGKLVKDPVLAWKYIRYPKPYKEES